MGVDISQEELLEAEQRAGGMRGAVGSFLFHRASCDAPDLLRDLYAAIIAAPRPPVLDPRAQREQSLCGFNVVWCQFALHYFCGSRESLQGFLRNASLALTRGGRLCASFPNPCAIISHLNHMAQTGERRSGSDVCFVSVDRPEPVSPERGLRDFGLKYLFTLGDAVQGCPEYVVPLHSLVSLAAEQGLRLVRLLQMHAHMTRCAGEPELVALREVMQVTGPKSPGRGLSADEWAAIGLYCVAVFEKA